MTTTSDRTPRRSERAGRGRPRVLMVVIPLLLFGVPWWTLVGGADWPVGVVVGGTTLFVAALVALPILMVHGHGRRQRDGAAKAGDTLLGVTWVLFAWSVLGLVVEIGLASVGVADPVRSRVVVYGVLVVVPVLLAYGAVEARRVPRVRELLVLRNGRR